MKASQFSDLPARDRYQLVQEYDAEHIRALDTGLGIQRTRDFVLVDVLTRPRPQAAKLAFYKILTSSLQDKCGVEPSDLMVSLAENGDDDRSFGMGRAQFLTGELGAAIQPADKS
ncbi:tautomerase family protein [Rhizobium leguminosarum]